MGNESNALIELETPAVPGRVFEVIDHAFAQIGCRPAKHGRLYNKSPERKPSGLDKLVPLPFSDFEFFPEEHLEMGYYYANTFFEEGALFGDMDVCLCFCERGRVKWVDITIGGECGKAAHNMVDIDRSLRMQDVVLRLHQSLGGRDTKGYDIWGYDDKNYRPWFRFSPGEWYRKAYEDDDYAECDSQWFWRWVEGHHPVDDEDWMPKEGENSVFPPEWWDRAPHIPIRYDREWNLYVLCRSLTAGGKERVLLRNCLCCGKPFPKSEWDEVYGRPDEKEEERFQRLAWRSFDMQQVIGELGEGFSELPPVQNYEEGRIRRGPSGDEYNVVRQIYYWSVSPRAVPIFRQINDGRILVHFAGK